jgi:TolB-like protein/Tfp pilus assembly protein PilF
MSSEPGLPTLFLSYAHEDQAQAKRIALALQRTGHAVWWDALIEGGTRFARTIDEALARADVIVVLWSRQSVQSDWVCDEAAQGRDRHRLVPLSLDGALPPLGFRQIQAVDVSHWNGRANAQQFTAVRRAIAAALGEEARPLPRVREPAVSRRQLVVGGSAVAVIAAGAAAWETGLLGPESPNSKRIAVLPFKNLSGDASQSYLSDGLTEEIRAALARNDGLEVLAPTSSEAAAGIAGNAQSLARKVGVSYLLEGSVQRVGDVVRVAINLISGRTGFSEWTQRVDRRLDDIFAFESEIARTVSKALSVRIATDDPAPGGTRNVRAYEAYLQGMELFNLAKNEDTDRQSRAHFELALSLDPNFALAHVGLSRILAVLADERSDASELQKLYDAAIAEARRAIAIAPTLARGHLALGYALFAGKLDVRGAQPSYDKAYRYGHGDADVGRFYAYYAASTRRFRDARDAIERALALDPLNALTHFAAGSIAYASRRYADAIPEYRRALELNRDASDVHAEMGDCLMLLGQIEAARAAYAAEDSPVSRLRGQAILEHRAGNDAAARKVFDQLISEAGDAASYQQAEVMAQWGRSDDAFRLLEKARAVGDSGLTYAATDPLLDPIAKDPRFDRFIKAIGFT